MKKERFKDIYDTLRQLKLSSAITQLENYLLIHQPADLDCLEAIRNDYDLMKDYWQQGCDDPKREDVFFNLLHRLYMLTARQEIRMTVAENSYLSALHKQSLSSCGNWSATTIYQDLEQFVIDVTMLQLRPEHERQSQADHIYNKHYGNLRQLFAYVVTSSPWSDGEASTYEQMLLSPTIDLNDQLLLMSAIMLSCRLVFDFNKFTVMLNVYRKTSELSLRERALVGWVLSADDDALPVYPQMREMVTQSCADENCRQELCELQMQLYYCLDAETDREVIHSEIIPDLLKNSHMEFTHQGLVEMDEDKLEEILHPDVEEKRMEQLEQSMQRMADMQKRGADIYFGGFAQMKRFSFFNDLSNWFMPYDSHHPGISNILNNTRGKKFLLMITRFAAFCDSDKYSMVLAYEQVLNHLPANILKMVDDGEAMPEPIAGELSEEDRHSAAFVRRNYLQNIYRFYRLFPARSAFVDVFDSHDRNYLFFAKNLFSGIGLDQQALQVAGFLVKRDCPGDALSVMTEVNEMRDDFNYCMLMASIMEDAEDKLSYYHRASLLQPDNEKVLSGMARQQFKLGFYIQALDTFDRLLTIKPDHRSYLLNKAVCLMKTDSYDEAMKLLYKLNYQYPNDLRVSRVLAWGQAMTGKMEQALKFYADITADGDSCLDEDLLNYGLCLWINHDVRSAADMLHRYYCQTHDKESLDNEILVHEKALLKSRGISDIEMQLMIEQAILGQ